MSMSLHRLSQPPDDDEAPASCSFTFHIGFQLRVKPRGAARRRRPLPPPPYSKKSKSGQAPADAEGQVVRHGVVRVEKYGADRSWFFKTNWLVLTDARLALHPSANKAPRVVIPLSEILKLERSDIKPYCLILETKDGRRYLLTFRNDSELYDWQDQISRREDMGVSSPRNFKHIVHVGVDHRNQTYTGLPAEWAKQLSYPQGKLHPTFSRPPPKDVPEDVAPEKHFVHVTLEHPGDTGHIATLLPVDPNTTMQEVRMRVCRKTKLEPSECALMLPEDRRRPVSLSSTVADLWNIRRLRHELVLIPFASSPPAYDV